MKCMEYLKNCSFHENLSWEIYISSEENSTTYLHALSVWATYWAEANNLQRLEESGINLASLNHWKEHILARIAHNREEIAIKRWKNATKQTIEDALRLWDDQRERRLL